MRKLFKVSFVFVLFVLFAVATASQVVASTVIFNRGLPTANLNNAAGASRSNVLWADGETYDPNPAADEYWLAGDSFKISGPGTYTVDKITVWSTNNDSSLTLWFGPEGGTIAPLTSIPTLTSVTYLDTTTYQGNSGAFRPLYKVDFPVNLVVNGDETYQFFLDGQWSVYSDTLYAGPFIHASNAALSGSVQEGTDDTFLWLHRNGGNNVAVETWFSGTGGGTSLWGPGWDKNSDGNVQVYGVLWPTYTGSGFQSPVDNPAIPIKVKKNRVIPFKAELLDAAGSPVTSLTSPPVIQLWFNTTPPAGTPSTDVLLSVGQGTEGNRFVFSDGKWQFNLQTKGMAPGTYYVQMVPGGSYIIANPPTAQFVIE